MQAERNALTGIGMVPLKDRHGRVKAWAKVDLADFAAIASHRWYRSGNYAVRNVWIESVSAQRTLSMHRAVAGLGYGDPLEVDHRNRDHLDNRRSNLRVVTRAQNAQNLSPEGLPNSSSRYRGVSFWRKRRKWIAQVVVNHRNYHLGYFDEEEAAREAVADFRREHMPFAAE